MLFINLKSNLYVKEMEDVSENESIDSLIESLIKRLSSDESFKQEFLEFMNKHKIEDIKQVENDIIAIEQYERLADQFTKSIKKKAKEPIKFVKLF